MELNEYIFLLAWFLAGFVNAFAGMGAAMVAVPLITPFMPTSILTPVACAIVFMISVHMTWNFRKGILLKPLKTLLMGAVPGAFVGLAMLVYLPTAYMRIFTGIVMLGFVYWQAMNKEHIAQGDETLIKSLFAGFCSGVLTTAISFGNPPVGIYALYLGWTPLQLVGTTNLFANFVYSFSSIIQAGAGLYTKEALIWVAMGIPAAMFGIVCAMPLTRRISPNFFKRVLLFVIAAGAISCIWRGFAALIA